MVKRPHDCIRDQAEKDELRDEGKRELSGLIEKKQSMAKQSKMLKGNCRQRDAREGLGERKEMRWY